MNETILHRTPLDLSGAETAGLARLPFSEGLFRLTAASGTLQSPRLEASAPFNDLVGSWNALVPEGARVEMQVQAHDGSDWSGWFSLGWTDAKGFHSPGEQRGDWGFVDIDTLKLSRPASAFRYRILMSRGAKAPLLKLVAAALADGAAPAEPPEFASGPWVRELKLKPLSQMEEQERFRRDICSPTSLAMTLAHWGRGEPVEKIALAVQDRTTGKFGVWPANVWAAGTRGLEAFVARLESIDALQAEIAAGRPAVVSVSFGPGELAGAPLPKTRGHLLVVAGFTERGDVIVQDPAAPTRRQTRRVYDRAQFHRAWRRNKLGLVYLAARPLTRSLVVAVPVADLWSKPGPRRRLDLSDPEHLSQLLFGETVSPLSAEGDWIRGRAEEQLAFKGGAWQGYPGWVRADALRSRVSPYPANATVRTRQALVHIGDELLPLSVGTRVNRLPGSRDGLSLIRLLDGRVGAIDPDSLNQDRSRHQVIKTAELFLGTSYYWGGRSGVQTDLSVGVDCSGLTSLAYRIAGIDIPRDSHEQKLRARPVPPSRLKPGDLVFLTESSRAARITHVILYTGGDAVIESRKSAGRTVRSSFKERFGRPLSEIKAGELLTDYSFPKPRKRRIYFGTYFPEVVE